MAGIHSDLLRAAKALISKPEAWTQHYFARDESRKVVSAYSPEAVCFCGYGALKRVMHGSTDDLVETSFYLNHAVRTQKSYGHWQDKPQRTHDEVMAVFDQAITQAEKDGL